MRILYLGNATSPHTQKMVQYFANRGNEIHIASLVDWQIEKAVIHSFRRPTVSKLDYLANIGRVRKLIKQVKPDILHALYATSYGFLGALTGFHPFVISAWGLDVIGFPETSALHRRFLIQNLAKADAICVASHQLAKATKVYLKNGKQIVIAPGGVDLNLFRPVLRPQNGNLTVGIVKSLEPKYGVEYLIRAFANVRNLNSNLQLLIVGDGYLRRGLEKLSRDLQIASMTRFIGRVPHSEVPGWLGKIDIFANPSVHESETFGVAVVEASATELPVIASNIGGLPEVVEDGVTGFLVPSQDVDALSEKLAILIQDANLRQKMGRAGRDFVKRFYDWNQNAKIFEDLYASLLKKRA